MVEGNSHRSHNNVANCLGPYSTPYSVVAGRSGFLWRAPSEPRISECLSKILHIYIYIYIYIHICRRARVYICAHMYTYICVYACIHTSAYMCVDIYTRMRIPM